MPPRRRPTSGQLAQVRKLDELASRDVKVLWRELTRDQRWAVVASARRWLEHAQSNDPKRIDVSFPLALLSSLREL